MYYFFGKFIILAAQYRAGITLAPDLENLRFTGRQHEDNIALVIKWPIGHRLVRHTHKQSIILAICKMWMTYGQAILNQWVSNGL